MNLIVIRHAIAMDHQDFHQFARQRAKTSGSDSDVETNDDLRPLTEEGARKMKKNAKGLSRMIDQPDLLVTSPLLRALQTTEILKTIWPELDIATTDHLRPDAEPADFDKWLKTQPQAEKPDALIALVGHEPHLSLLTSWWTAGAVKSLVEIKKGGALMLSFSHRSGKSRAQIAWLATPSMLRAMR